MAKGYDVVSYELWDAISGNMLYYTTNFSEIVELIIDNPEHAEDWEIYAEVVLMDGEPVQIKMNILPS